MANQLHEDGLQIIKKKRVESIVLGIIIMMIGFVSFISVLFDISHFDSGAFIGLFFIVSILIVGLPLFFIILGVKGRYFETYMLMLHDSEILLHYYEDVYLYYCLETKRFQYKKKHLIAKPFHLEDIISLELFQNDESIKLVKDPEDIEEYTPLNIFLAQWHTLNPIHQNADEYTMEILVNDLSHPRILLKLDQEGFERLIAFFKVVEYQEKHKYLK